MKITEATREAAIEILRCCADNGMHGSGGWTGRVAECLGYRVYGKEERLADKAWWAAYGLRSSPMDHATICLEAAAWLEEGGTPMTDPNIIRDPVCMLPVVAAVRCVCGAEVQGEHVVRGHRPATTEEIQIAERIARRNACVEAERIGWAVAPHGQERDLCARCR